MSGPSRPTTRSDPTAGLASSSSPSSDHIRATLVRTIDECEAACNNNARTNPYSTAAARLQNRLETLRKRLRAHDNARVAAEKRAEALALLRVKAEQAQAAKEAKEAAQRAGQASQQAEEPTVEQQTEEPAARQQTEEPAVQQQHVQEDTAMDDEPTNQPAEQSDQPPVEDENESDETARVSTKAGKQRAAGDDKEDDPPAGLSNQPGAEDEDMQDQGMDAPELEYDSLDGDFSGADLMLAPQDCFWDGCSQTFATTNELAEHIGLAHNPDVGWDCDWPTCDPVVHCFYETGWQSHCDLYHSDIVANATLDCDHPHCFGYGPFPDEEQLLAHQQASHSSMTEPFPARCPETHCNSADKALIYTPEGQKAHKIAFHPVITPYFCPVSFCARNRYHGPGVGWFDWKKVEFHMKSSHGDSKFEFIPGDKNEGRLIPEILGDGIEILSLTDPTMVPYDDQMQRVANERGVHRWSAEAFLAHRQAEVAKAAQAIPDLLGEQAQQDESLQELEDSIMEWEP